MTGRMLRWGLLIVGAFFVLGCCFGSGVVVGLLREAGRSRIEQTHNEREMISPILAADPAYSRVEIELFSAGGIYLIGDVQTAADKDRLREQVIRAVGETRANHIVMNVEVKVRTP